ncbi:MAG TPA: hypothetical protein GX528_05525 [Firmicutes bacterium]|nr:hypothetical protein [Bacillota bacterium]
MRINLLPPEERPLKQSAIRWEFIVTLIGALGLVAVVIFAWLGSVRLEELNGLYEKGTAYEEVLYGQVRSVNELKSAISALQEEEEALAGLNGKENNFAALPKLLGHSFSRLWIEKVVWGPEVMSLVGYTEQPTSLSRYLNFLNEQAQNVAVTELNTIGATEFRTFKIEIRGVGGDG